MHNVDKCDQTFFISTDHNIWIKIFIYFLGKHQVAIARYTVGNGFSSEHYASTDTKRQVT
jgi:hypothetical protein